MQKTGMFVHGLNLKDEEWTEIIWGKPPHFLGRATTALHLLDTEYPQIDHVLFGSGASERDGVKEGAYIIQYLLDNWSNLRHFEAFGAHWWPWMWKLKDRFRRIAQPEIQSHNTYSELEFGIPRLYTAGCSRIVHVTEPTHISRARAHGEDILKKLGLSGKVSLVSESSKVMPAKVDPGQVVVFEPPPDGTNLLAGTAKRFFQVPADLREATMTRINQVLDEAIPQG